MPLMRSSTAEFAASKTLNFIAMDPNSFSHRRHGQDKTGCLVLSCLRRRCEQAIRGTSQSVLCWLIMFMHLSQCLMHVEIDAAQGH